MTFIKCKYIKGEQPHGRAYTFRTDDNLLPGDMVQNDKGQKLIVTDEPVDMDWVDAYGADMVVVVRKCVEEKDE